uniref:DIRP domain-containing protein n=1 Tax=Trichuris muris TaxID=70415 RepID=A0A5S6QRB6_TRIMR
MAKRSENVRDELTVKVEAEDPDGPQSESDGAANDDDPDVSPDSVNTDTAKTSDVPAKTVVPRRSARVQSKFMENDEGEKGYSRIAAGLARYYGTRFVGSRSTNRSSTVIRGTNDLPNDLKQNLKQLKNFLKLPKARRWAYFEFFYSDVDHELFLGPSEFHQCLQENFPMLKQRKLYLPEWRHIKRMIGKPRRLSQTFLASERQMLEKKRQRIREIQKGSAVVLGNDLQLPSKIPQPLTVGSKVFAKLHTQRDGMGVFAGTVDAVVEASYRIVFEKNIPAHIVPDIDVMAETPEDLVSVSFFLEKNKAAQPLPFRSNSVLNVVCSPATISSEMSKVEYDSALGNAIALGNVDTRDEKCGNYPVRLVTLLTKLYKLIERKRALLNMLRHKNLMAEHHYMRTFGKRYKQEFQNLYAGTVMKLGKINEQLDCCLKSVTEHSNNLLPHLTEVTLTSRPKTLRKLCLSRATQIVKQLSSGAISSSIASGSKECPALSSSTVDLITSFCSLLLQLKTLGQQPARTNFDFCTVRESVNEIKEKLEPKVWSLFEDLIELPVRHIELCASSDDPMLYFL